MGRILLATLVLLAFAMPAAAQISAGPVGPFAAVDDNGKLIGGLWTTEAGNAHVTLSTAEGNALVRLGYVDSATGTIPSDAAWSSRYDIYFTTADCTGQAYVSGGGPILDGGPRFVVDHDLILYKLSGPQTNVTVASALVEMSIGGTVFCQPMTNGHSVLIHRNSGACS